MMILRKQWQRGFTLIEAIVTMVVLGIIAGMVGLFIRTPIQQYTDAAARADMTDTADTALRRIGRDLRLSLPNSINVTNSDQTLTFLQTRAGGRYRAGPPGNALYPGETSASNFDVLGDMTMGGTVAAPAVGEWVVIYNLGIPGADALEGSNRASVAAGSTATNIVLNPSAMSFPLASPGNRFQIVESKVSYACAGGKLTRTWFSPPGAASSTSAVLADNVSACTFTYDQNILNQRYGLVTMTLVLTRNNETVTLYHEVHVSNVP